MVLLPKQWKSRSSPGFVAGVERKNPFAIQKAAAGESRAAAFLFDRAKVPKPQGFARPNGRPDRSSEREDSQAGGRQRRRLRLKIGIAGWSSPVARQAHNLKVVGSNPTPATTI